MLQVHIASFSYTENEILKNISFSLNKGKHLAVLGESGCGKSTLLHLIYGLLHLEHGSLSWNSKPLLGPRHNLVPGEPFMKLVAQEFNVMPFITVAENIATHLSRLDAESDDMRVSELLKVVDLIEHKDRMVKDLSGGQKQRVALAKALAKEPELLLLDEPFSHIDTFRKSKLRRTLFDYLKKKNIACITATHDSEEALAFSDKLLILKDGKMAALGTPEEIYASLPSVFVGRFFGEVTEVPAGILSEKKHILLPHQLRVVETATALKVTVAQSFFKGSHYLIMAHANGIDVFFQHPSSLDPHTECFLQKLQ
ncbi:ABC transporter ATP-binding protein [Aureisphaera galaxeae]|uniref:ABC transporter ATP-binding protein n=1 Tax=Aureisphaera galaxeae TaxID=1538023 RepID=UPI0023500D57|nr:ABC transporter ATP-binding protein [Aureisphaera galaxeae]MDC8005159.1 ABC transporter ATP-binding protein [Aureisphaera galaxeae]